MDALHRSVVVAVTLVLLGAGAAAGAPTTDVPLQSTGCPASTPAGDVPQSTAPTNESDGTTVAYGDIATLSVSVPVGGNATVLFGDDNRTAAVLVADDGDGRVSLEVNSYAVDPYWNHSSDDPVDWNVTGPAFEATGGDSVVAAERGDSLRPGSYPVTVTDGETVLDRTELTVTDPVVRNVTVRRATPQLFDADPATVRERAPALGGISYGDGTAYGNATGLVEGETLVVSIAAPSMLGVLRAQPGETSTERFVRLREDSDQTVPIAFDLWGPCGGIALQGSHEAGAVRVVPDQASGTVHLLVDSGRAVGSLWDGETRIYTPNPAWVDGNPEAWEEHFKTSGEERRVDGASEDHPQLTLSAADGETISGQTNFLVGSEIPVVVQSRVDPSLRREATAVVGENGSFSVTVDLSNASADAPFAVAVGDWQYSAATGSVDAPYWEVSKEGPGVDIVGSDTPSEFVVAYRYDGERFHHVDAVQPGDGEAQLTVPGSPAHILLVAHHDANDDQFFAGPVADPPVRVDGRPVQQWVTLASSDTDPGPRPDVGFDVALLADNDSETGTDDADDNSETGDETDDGPSDSDDGQTDDSSETDDDTNERQTDSDTSDGEPSTATETDQPRPSTVDDSAGTTATESDRTTTGDGPGFGPVAAVLGILATLGLLSRRR